MGITKILIIVLLIWAVFKVNSVIKSRAKKSDNDRLNKKIIPCSFCKTHVPVASAIKVKNKYFCSINHSKKCLNL